MKVRVKVKPNAKVEKIEEIDGVFHISVKEPPYRGYANRAVIGVLARHFGVSKDRVSMIAGGKSRDKTFLVLT